MTDSNAGHVMLPEGGVPDLEIVLIAAVAANGVIGHDGEMPWNLPADLRRFKTLTTGHPVVMGRRTFESIVRDLSSPLPDRTNIVLTSRDALDHPGDGEVVVVGSVDAALEAAAGRDDVAFVAGGGTVYEQFLPIADRLELTELTETVVGDTWFPPIDEERWREVAREDHDGFVFVTYERT